MHPPTYPPLEPPTGIRVSQVVPSRRILRGSRQHRSVVRDGFVEAAQRLEGHAPAWNNTEQGHLLACARIRPERCRHDPCYKTVEAWQAWSQLPTHPPTGSARGPRSRGTAGCCGCSPTAPPAACPARMNGSRASSMPDRLDFYKGCSSMLWLPQLTKPAMCHLLRTAGKQQKAHLPAASVAAVAPRAPNLHIGGQENRRRLESGPTTKKTLVLHWPASRHRINHLATKARLSPGQAPSWRPSCRIAR